MRGGIIMRKLKECMVLSLTAIVMITSMIPVFAAKKKLTVKTVYNTSTKIKGKTKKEIPDPCKDWQENLQKRKPVKRETL